MDAQRSPRTDTDGLKALLPPWAIVLGIAVASLGVWMMRTGSTGASQLDR
jgi:hypothetical protein